MMNLFAKSSALIAAISLFIYATAAPVSQTEATAGPDPSQVYVRGITYGGAGCPQNTVSESFSADRTTFTLIFDQFVVSSGPGVAITERRKNCQLNIDLVIPNGWQYSIATIDYRGYVNLDGKLRGIQKAIYYFQGEVQQVSLDTVFPGPMSKDYLIHDEIPFQSVVWSECNRVVPVNVNAQIRLEDIKGGQIDPNARGTMTTDSIDGKVRHIMGLQFKKC